MNPQSTAHSHPWLGVLETELRTQPLHIFTHKEWSILSYLPGSRHWRLVTETPIQDVIEESYEVIELEGLLEDHIDDPHERAWYVEMLASSPVLCTPLRLRNEIGTLLTKLMEMPRKQEVDLARLLDLAFMCFVMNGEHTEITPEYSSALVALQESPIWAAYTANSHITYVPSCKWHSAEPLQMGKLF